MADNKVHCLQISATQGDANNSSFSSSSPSIICKLCLNADAKYTCPRCNISYCSVQCYQSEKHGGCSEAFYKDWVLNELKEMTNGPEDRQKVLDMLNKDLEQKADESDEDLEDDLAERISGLDLDKEYSLVWSRLTQKEKEDFARKLQDGRLSHLIEIWTPWWRSEINHSLISEQEKNNKSAKEQMPTCLPDVPDINDILKKNKPSANLRFNLINILFSYAYITRVHNGNHLECPFDSAQDLMESCQVLKDQSNFSSVGEAVQTGIEFLHKKGKEVKDQASTKFFFTLLEDVKMIISGPGRVPNLTFMSSALSDLVVLLKSSLTVIKAELLDQENPSEDLKSLKSAVFKAEKKLLFLLSWLQRYGMGMHQLLPILQFEIETKHSEYEEVNTVKSFIEENLTTVKTDKQVHNGICDKIVELN
ncbi:zinc finger HIT domain-containing protein 2-like [Physella acuta]|uniref:zinc finger HIT domain-containing protein 2-like n=1 Tax=Physella acuta TaxID=109671 RepID=UPI0027DBEF21|nr:zinc finger HIT domain-containing protein 2-like [Physella acuta]